MIRRKPTGKFEGSDAELLAMTRDLDAAHRESMIEMDKAAREFSSNLRDLGTVGLNRRHFLLGVGAVGATFALAACGDDKEEAAPAADSPKSGGSKYTGDLAVVAFAAALENQAVGAYDAALMAATAGALGKVPAAVGVFATTAKAQHAEHAQGWNAVLTSNNLEAISGVPLKGHQAVLDQLGAVKDVGAVAKLALTLEDQAASTYLLAAGAVSDPGGIKTAASIAPVEAMHSAILRYVLGMYPAPDALITTDKAANPADFTG